MIEKILVNGEEHGITLADNMIGEGLAKASDGSISVTIEGGGEFTAIDKEGMGIEIPYKDNKMYLGSGVNIGLPIAEGKIQIGTMQNSRVKIGTDVFIGAGNDARIQIGEEFSFISIGAEQNSRVEIGTMVTIKSGAPINIGNSANVSKTFGSIEIGQGAEIGGRVKIGTYTEADYCVHMRALEKNMCFESLQGEVVISQRDDYSKDDNAIEMRWGTKMLGCDSLQFKCEESGISITSYSGNKKVFLPWQS